MNIAGKLGRFPNTTRKPTMMNIRIRISNETVKNMIRMLQKTYKSGDTKMVRRILVLLDYSRGDHPTEIASKHGIAVSSLYQWLTQLLTEGLDSLKPQWRGGRPAKLTKSQKKQLWTVPDLMEGLE